MSSEPSRPPGPGTSDGLTLPLPPSEAPTLPPAASTPPVPARAAVPGYEVLAELGRGGMGVVYQARQLKLGRVVALKMILSGGHASATELARFTTEAEAIARLHHPNIVQIHEIGECEGLPFFSLEFCAGGSLEKRLNGTPLPAREAAELVETLARAMHAAHQKDVIHRDLKPANVLLAVGQASCLPSSGRQDACPTDGWVPKITDFGLARKLDEAGQTASGAVMGTPSYMAPEQAGGKSNEIGPLADVYSLGAILYECLTGRPPFKAATALDTLVQVVADEPVQPGRLQSKVPRDLETICLKCLRKEPKKRYGSARELADDLRRFQNGEPIQARPAGRLERAVKWARRRPAVSALLAVSVLAAAGLLALAGLWYSARLTLAAEEARRQSEDAEHQRQRAEENSRMLGQVRAEKARAEEQTRLAEQRLERARRTAHALQLRQVRDLAARAPAQGIRLLTDPALCAPDLRDFTWGHLARRCSRKRRLWSGFATDVSFAPDGKTLAAVCWELTKRDPVAVATLWDVASGRRLHRLTLEKANALRVAISPDGQTLAVGDSAGAVTLWDVSSGKRRHRLTGHRAGVAWVAFRSDGKRLASAGGEDRTVRLWDPMAGKELARLEGPTRPVLAVAFAPDGSLAGASSKDGQGEVWLWDAAGKEVGRLGPVPALSLSFAPDGRTLAVGTAGWRVQLWDVKTRTLRQKLAHEAQDFSDVCYSPDGRRLAVLSRLSSGVSLWDIATSKEQEFLGGLLGMVNRIAFPADGRSVAVACSLEGPFGLMGELSIWDVEDRGGRLLLAGSGVTTDNLAVNPRGDLAAVPGKGGTVRLVRLPSGEERQVLRGPGGEVRLLAFSAGGDRLAAADDRGAVKVWEAGGKEVLSLEATPDRVHALALAGQRLLVLRDVGGKPVFTLQALDTGRKVADLAGHARLPAWTAFSLDGHSVTTLSVEERNDQRRTPKALVLLVQHWEAATGKRLGRHEYFAPTAAGWFTELHAERTPDGRAVLAAGKGMGGVRVLRWDLAAGRGKELLTVRANVDPVPLALSPDGKTLAVTSSGTGTSLTQQTEVFLLDVASGERRVVLSGHAGLVMALAFSPDGRTLASGDLAGGVRLWDPVVGQERLTLEDADGVQGLRFSGDGRTLLAAAVSGSAHAWTVSPDPPRSSLAVEDFTVPLSFRPNGKSLVLTTPARDGVVAFDLTTGKPVSLDPDKGGPVGTEIPPVRNKGVELEPALSADGRWLASAGDDPTAATVIIRATLGKGTPVVLRGHTAAVTAAAFAPGAAVVATAAKDRTVRLWDRAGGRESRRLVAPPEGVQELRFTADGRTLAGRCGNRLHLWELTTKREVASLELPARAACFAVSANGRRVAWPAATGRLVIWDRETGRTRLGSQGHEGAVRCMEFSADGRTLASAGEDRTVRLWDAATGRQRARLEVPGLVHGLLFSAEGGLLAAGMSSGANLGELTVWNLSGQR